MMQVTSTQLGTLEVTQDLILQFPYGLPGFRSEKEFVMVPLGPDSPFLYMQSLVNADLTFLLVEPFNVFKDYSFEIDDEIAAEVGFSEANQPQIYNIVTVPDILGEMTANLMAPILVNWENRTGFQLVLENTVYGVKHRVFPNGLPKTEGE